MLKVPLLFCLSTLFSVSDEISQNFVFNYGRGIWKKVEVVNKRLFFFFFLNVMEAPHKLYSFLFQKQYEMG